MAQFTTLVSTDSPTTALLPATTCSTNPSATARQFELQELLHFQQHLQESHHHPSSTSLDYYNPTPSPTPSSNLYHNHDRQPPPQTQQIMSNCKDNLCGYTNNNSSSSYENAFSYPLPDHQLQQPCTHHHHAGDVPNEQQQQSCDNHQDHRRKHHERHFNRREHTPPPLSPPIVSCIRQDAGCLNYGGDEQQPQKQLLHAKRKFDITERPHNHKRFKGGGGEEWDQEPAKKELRLPSPVPSLSSASAAPSLSHSPPPLVYPASPPGVIVPFSSLPFSSRSPSPQSPARPFSPSPLSSPLTFIEGATAEEETGDRWFRSSSFLLKMMDKMGFQWGKGLGKELQGVTELPGKLLPQHPLLHTSPLFTVI